MSLISTLERMATDLSVAFKDKFISKEEALDKATYDTDNDGIIDKAETLEGLTKTVDELNNTLTADNIIAGENVTITKDIINNKVTISTNKCSVELNSLPTFSKQ